MDGQAPAEGHDVAQSRLLRAWLERGDDLVFVVDPELRLTHASTSLATLTGQPVAEIIGRPVEHAGLFGRQARDLAGLLAAAVAGRSDGDAELAWPGSAGHSRFFRISVIGEPAAQPRQWLVVARDVTESRRVEDSLRRREYEFRTLAENSPDNIIRYGLDQKAIYCNREIEERVNVSAASLVGRTPAEAAPPGMKGVEGYEEQLRRTLSTGEGGQVELQVPSPSGELRVHSVVFAAERDAQGAICGAVAVGRDVTEQVRIRRALAEKEREFRALAENSPDVIMRYDRNLRVTYVNPTITEKTGLPVSQVLGRSVLESMPKNRVGREAYREQLEHTLRTGKRGRVETFAPPGGQYGMRAFHVEFIAERDEEGSICGVLAVSREVTEQYLGRRALEAKEREFRTLAENAIDNIARWDADARLIYCNPVMSRMLEAATELARGQASGTLSLRFAEIRRAVRQVVQENRPVMLQLRFPAGEHNEVVHEIRFVPEPGEDGTVASVLGIGRDVTEKIAQMEMIESLVRTDSLTRLANRQAMNERAPLLFAAAARSASKVGVMLLDIDHFKSINDGLGHSAGDELLQEISRRLSACLRANDLLVRLGGDEFVIVAPDFDDPEVIGIVAEKLQQALGRPASLGGRDVQVSASIGVAVFPDDGETLDALLSHADSAMYHAKRGGRARTEYYRRELSDAIQRRLLLETTMRHACEGEGLVLHFQPQVCMPSAVLVGAEALLRWQHPSLGLLMPDAFIGLAEETGMIVPMGRWVLLQAARAAVRWNRGREDPLRVSVNVSTRQFVDDDLPTTVREVLRDTGCDPGWLSVEITESALLEDSALVQHTLGALRGMGVRIHLDDFGTGYSALNYLARFPVDCLKIDKSFVWAIERSERERELVKAFIAMAGALKLGLVAEGVETEAQAAFLLANGCALGQGYRFGRPMPADRLESLLGPLTVA